MRVQTFLKSGEMQYTVVQGDSLVSISRKVYGPNASWDDTMMLYKANRDLIGPDPTKLSPGLVLLVPDDPLHGYYCASGITP